MVVYTAPPIYQAFHADPNVSKQDTHFFNTFSMVIGLLIVIAIGIGMLYLPIQPVAKVSCIAVYLLCLWKTITWI